MKFHCVLINQFDHSRKEKVFTKEELEAITGSYVTDRAKKLGETNTTIINNGTTYKMLIKYLKN